MKHMRTEGAEAAPVQAAATPSEPTKVSQEELERRMAALESAERAIEGAFSTGSVDRAKITRGAQDSMAEAIVLTHAALEADEEADEATRLTLITEQLNDREAAKDARRREREARKQAKTNHRAATKAAKKAYNAIRFSEVNRMGFMRVIQVMFVFHILGTLLYLLLSSRDTINYNSSSILDWVMVILEGITFWLLITRYRIARPFGIGMVVFNIVADGVIDAMNGRFDPVAHLWYSSFNIILLLYLIFSERAKMILVNDIGARSGDYDGEHFTINRRGWPFIRNCIMYFIVFSVLGHWMEAAMCQLIIAGLVEGEYDPTNTMLWRDWLYPFPMEGAAVVFIALFLYPLKEWLVKKIKNPILPYILSFLANALVCSLIEFSMGLIINADHQLWDYSENFGNIMGQVCLQNALAFGAAASIITWFVYPLMERYIARVPRNIMNVIFVAVLIFGGMLWSLYIIDPPAGLDVAEDVAEAASSPLPLLRGSIAGAGARLARGARSLAGLADVARPGLM